MSSTPAISADGLRKRYGTLDALDGFDLHVEPGTIHGLLGPNGAGKSTAVGVLATLLDADAGTATVAGFDVRTQGADVRRSIGLVGQSHAVDDILGGRQNLIMFGRLAGLGKTAARTRAAELLARFDLEAAAEKPAAQYSGGMRRRLDIAIALILDPAVLFLDEPTTGLDPRGRAEVWLAVQEAAARGTAVLLTTQYLDEADRLAGRIAVMQQGRVIAEGSPAELKRSIGGDRIVVTPSSASDLSAVENAVVTTGLASSVDAEAGWVTVAAPGGTAELVRVVKAIDEAGIPLADCELRRPTLDDVFLTLTEQESR